MKQLFALVAVLLAGCAGPGYKVTQLDDRFSDFRTYAADGNRISTKSIAGGIHIDGKGLQINPLAEFTRSGELFALHLALMNVTDYNTQYGAPNSIGTPRAVDFLADGQRISIPLSGEHRYADTVLSNSVDRSLTVNISEYGVGSISPENFAAIVEASDLVVRVTGSKQSHTYENEDVLPSFRANMRDFYTRYATQPLR